MQRPIVQIPSEAIKLQVGRNIPFISAEQSEHVICHEADHCQRNEEEKDGEEGAGREQSVGGGGGVFQVEAGEDQDRHHEEEVQEKRRADVDFAEDFDCQDF